MISRFLGTLAFVPVVFCLLTTGNSALALSLTLFDSVSGMVLIEKEQHKKLNPGDFVQLMTLYTALRLTDGKDRSSLTVTVPESNIAARQNARRLYLRAGQTVSFNGLIKAVAVTNAEDACHVLAGTNGLNTREFVEKMNFYAAEAGMKNSLFTSPVTAPGQVSSAYDLALLTQEIRTRYPDVFALFSEKTFSFAGNNQRNRNLLLWRGDDIDGVMSNKTSTAFIASSVHKKITADTERRLIAVYLPDRNARTDVSINQVLTLFRKGRADFETIRLFTAGTPVSALEVLGGNRNRLEVAADKDIWVSIDRAKLAARGTGGITGRVEYKKPVLAPVRKGDDIARLHAEFEGKELSSFPLRAMYDIGEGSTLSRFIDSVRLKLNAEPTEKK